jgi:hypothetical protein
MGDLLSSQWSFHRSYRWSELSKKNDKLDDQTQNNPHLKQRKAQKI